MKFTTLLPLLALEAFYPHQGPGSPGKFSPSSALDSRTALGIIDRCQKGFFRGLAEIPFAYKADWRTGHPSENPEMKKVSLEYTKKVFEETWKDSNYNPRTNFLRFFEPGKESEQQGGMHGTTVISFKDKEGSLHVRSGGVEWEIWSVPAQGYIHYWKDPKTEIEVLPWDPQKLPRPDPWGHAGQEDFVSGMEFAKWALKLKKGTSLELGPGHLHLVWKVARPIPSQLPPNHGFHPGFYMIGGGIVIDAQETDSGWNFSEIQVDQRGNVLSRWFLEGIGAGGPCRKTLDVNFFPGTQAAMGEWDFDFAPMDLEEARKAWMPPDDLEGRRVIDRRKTQDGMERIYLFHRRIPSMEEFEKIPSPLLEDH